MLRKLTLLSFILCLFIGSAGAQSWSNDSKTLAFGFGGSAFIHTTEGGRGNPGRADRLVHTPLTAQFYLEGEFAVGAYVGLGFFTGVGGRNAYHYSWTGYDGSVNVPLGLLVNFHVYQYMADKLVEDVHADKLDVYIGLSVGGGMAALFYPKPYDTQIVGMLVAGGHIGANYYFTPNVGVSAQVGFGKQVASVGLIFKLNR